MFLISFLVVSLSSYFILSSILNDNKKCPAFLYILLIAFSQIVLSFELLSLLKSITVKGVLVSNVVFFIFSVLAFILSGKHFYKPQIEVKKIFLAFKNDKALKFTGICFIFFCIFQIIKIFFFPVTFGDALVYYLPRCTHWIQNGSISHFITPDTRELIMSVNMDFLFSWYLLLKKSEIGIAIFSFIGYTGAVYVIYNLLRELNFSVRRCLWTVFVFSSFALVVLEITTPGSNLFTGALILASIYLFFKHVKYNNFKDLFFSSFAYALAAGTKTTAIIAIPSVFLILCAILFAYKKNIKSLVQFAVFFIFNFFIFSSYNYILNFIQFSNAFTTGEEYLIHEFTGGLKGYIANVIKYFFTFFDISGINLFFDYGRLIENMQSFVLSIFGTNETDGANNYFPCCFKYTSKMGLTESLYGALGLLAFLPSIIYAIKRGIQNKKSKTAFLMVCFASSLIFNIFLFSKVMVFANYNMRYIFTFAIIASPVLAYSYPAIKHKFYKIVLCFVMFIYLIGYTHTQPVSFLISCINQQKIIKMETTDEENSVYKYFINKNLSNVALIAEWVNSPVYFIEKLRLSGVNIDKILPEIIDKFDISQYDFIITSKETVSSTMILNYKERTENALLYPAACIYKDKNANIINNYNKNIKPVRVECEIPFEYLEQKGFKEDTNYNGIKYKIFYKQ